MPCCCNTLHLLLKESMASCPPWKSLSAPYFSLVMPVHSPEQHPQLKDLKCIHTKDFPFFFFLYKSDVLAGLCVFIIIQFNQNWLPKHIYPGIHPPKWLDVNFKFENLGCPRALQPCSCRSHWLNGKKKLPCLLLHWNFLKKRIR